MSYSATPSRLTEEQRELAARYVPMARAVAGQRSKRLPVHLRGDERVSDAYLGLIVAARKYNPNKGASFHTYAMKKVHGRISDELRDGNFLSRAARKRGVRSPLFHSAATVLAEDSRNVTLSDVLEDKSEPAGFRSEQLDALSDIVGPLPARKRHVIARYFVDDWTMKEIGAELGIGQSRVSQMLSSALRFIRERNSRGRLTQ